MFYRAYFFVYSMLKIDTLGISLSCFYGTYILFIIIDQVILAARQTVVWKYIFCNPDKLDGKLLVSSFGCAAETGDIEFEWTRRHSIAKGTHLARHLIQAFEPGEVSAEEAHEIGMQLAKEILGGKYEFVLTTHIDKGHIHNHLIFNAVSFTDHKRYHSNERSYHEIRRARDLLCREHGLSVIIPGRDKDKSYIEYQAAQNGTSYKAAESRRRPSNPRVLQPGRFACLVAARRIRNQAGKVYLRQGAGAGAVHLAQNPGCRLHGRSRCLPHCRRPQAIQTAPTA